MKERFPRYSPDDAPAVLMNIDNHNATRRIFNEWRSVWGGKIDWSKVSPTEIQELSERMFDAADVPASVRAEYYKQLKTFLETLN